MGNKAKADVEIPVDPAHPNYDVGTPVVVLRPSIWFNCAGTVESVRGGLHRVLISGLNGEQFHADVPAKMLRVDL